MEIYFLRKNDFLKSVDLTTLEGYSDGRKYNCEEKRLEHLCGLFLTKFIAHYYYDVEDTTIILKGKKPVFQNSRIQFSLSHSHDLVLVGFNNHNIGIDVEYMYPRKNYVGIMQRYGKNCNNPTRKDFYRFWTLLEAEIKLDAKVKSLFSTYIDENYIVSCVSEDILVTDVSIKEVICVDKNLNLLKEFDYPKNLIIKSY